MSLEDRRDRQGNGNLRVYEISFADDKGKPVTYLQTGNDIQIILKYKLNSDRPVRNVFAAIAIDSLWGERLLQLRTDYYNADFPEIDKDGSIICSIPRLPLAAGLYTFTIFISSGGEIIDWIQKAGNINVEDGDFYGYGRSAGKHDGFVLIDHKWSKQ
jgi:hypothetical protein